MPAYAEAYTQAIRRLGSLARKNFTARARVAVVAAGQDDVPDWVMVDLDELFTSLEGAELLELRTRSARHDMAEAALGAWADALDPVARNRVTGEVERVLADRIVGEALHVRREVGVLLRHAHDEGHSIQRAARDVQQTFVQFSRTRATVIARTEMIGASNAASLASVRTLGAASHKRWLATPDNRTRDTHRAANDQVVAIADPFSVGGASLMYPGDEAAPANETIQCRCTMTYEEDPVRPITASTAEPVPVAGRDVEIPTRLSMPGVMRFVATSPVTDGVASWSGMLAPLAQKTGDGRMLDPAEPGAISWRVLPLTLMAQFETQPGHDGAQIAGRIDTIEVGDASYGDWSGQGFNATGTFDAGEFGLEAHRMVTEQVLRGVSVDLAVDEVEMRTADNEPIDEDDEEAWLEAYFGDGIMVVTRGQIMGATLTPFPAFEEASVAVVASIAAAMTPGALAAPIVSGEQIDTWARLRDEGLVTSNEVRGWMGLEAHADGDALAYRDPRIIGTDVVEVVTAAATSGGVKPRLLRAIRDDHGKAIRYEPC